MDKYYVYCFLDPTKPGKYSYSGIDVCFLYEPFYIGKGSGNRINRHFHKDVISKESNLLKKRKIEKIIKNGFTPIRFKIYENLIEIDSLEKEKNLINNIGRRDLKNGCLCNMSDGGERGKRQNMEKSRKKICYYSQSGNLIGKFNSITEACNNLYGQKLSKGNISMCCRSNNRTYKEYVWRYEGDEFNFIKYDNGKKILQTTSNLIFKSVKDCSEYLKIPTSNLIDMLRGRRKNKYSVKYWDPESDKNFEKIRNTKNFHGQCKLISQLSVDGVVIQHWTGASNIQNELKINASSIIQCCKGKRSQIGGFKWEYTKNNTIEYIYESIS